MNGLSVAMSNVWPSTSLPPLTGLLGVGLAPPPLAQASSSAPPPARNAEKAAAEPRRLRKSRRDHSFRNESNRSPGTAFAVRPAPDCQPLARIALTSRRALPRSTESWTQPARGGSDGRCDPGPGVPTSVALTQGPQLTIVASSKILPRSVAYDLQSIVDNLGRRVKRAVLLDDAHMRVLAYNSQLEVADAVRTASIMHRRAPAAAREWALARGIRAATQPVRLPANLQLGMLSRVCAPVRCQNHLYGFLWLVDSEATLTGNDLEAIQQAADAAGQMLHRERLTHALERGRERELLRDLLSADVTVRQHAADELIEANLMGPTRAAAVLVVRLGWADGSGPTNSDRVTIGLALDQVRRTLTPRHSVHLVRPDHGVLMVDCQDPVLRSCGLAALGRRLYDAVQGRLQTSEATSVVGIGEPQVELSKVAESHQQAQQAALVAETVPSHSPVADWASLGIYRMLLQFPVDQLRAAMLHPGVIKLLYADRHRDLIRTLELYFDLGGDAQRTAASLGVHKASLYYRLHKIESIAGVDLRNGDDRLAMHLGLKLARFACMRLKNEERPAPRAVARAG